MATLFEHIVSRRLSQEYENVATEALAFIVQADEKAHAAFVELLRGAQPDLNRDLVFSTQEGQGVDARPDLVGAAAGGTTNVFVENKFWAGLTEAQPVLYLKHLGRPGTLLVFVVPDMRVGTVWEELCRRLAPVLRYTEIPASAGFERLATTELGPRLALTSWGKVLWALELGVADNPARTSDLNQLRGLCERSDAEAFLPLSPEEITDQRVPARLLQLSGIAEKAVSVGRERGLINVDGLRPTHFFDRMGRYLRLGDKQGAIGWFGLDLTTWCTRGRTPLWVRYWAQAAAMGPVLQDWAVGSQRAVVVGPRDVLIGIDVLSARERDAVVDDVVAQLAELQRVVPRVESAPVPDEATA